MNRRGRWPACVAALALLAAGCGSAEVTSSGPPPAKELLITAKQLPKEYRLANGQDYPGELAVCDVALEPKKVDDFAIKRFTRTFAGPFLYEYVFVSGESAGRRLVEDLDRALRTCAAPTITTDEEHKVPVHVTQLKQLPSYGDASVGFRIDPRRKGVVSEYLLIRRDDVVVLLFTVAIAKAAPRELLLSGATAAMDQLS